METFKNVASMLGGSTGSGVGQRLEQKHDPSDILKIKNKRDYIKFLYSTARTLYGECQYESAIRFYEKLLTFKGEFDVKRTIMVYNDLMRCYTEEGKSDEVDRIFKQISRLDFSKIPLAQVFVSFYELAISYYRRGDFNTSLTIVDNAIRGYDDGEISKINKLQATCIEVICKLLLLKIDVLFFKNDYTECYRYIELLNTLDKEKKLFSYITLIEAQAASDQGRMLDSLKKYRSIINHEKYRVKRNTGPIASQVYLHLAILFYKMSKYNSSKKYFYKYLTCTRSGRSAHANMLLSNLIASYNFQEGDFREAESTFTRLLGTTVSHRAKNKSFEAKQGLFNLYIASNNLEEAKVTLDTTYKFIQSSTDDVNRRKLEIEWARYFIAEGSYSKAIEISERAIKYFSEKKLYRDLAKLYGIVARAHILRKEYVLALKAISRLEKISTDNYLRPELLAAKLLKIVTCKSLNRENLLAEDIEVARKLISRKIGGIVYMVIFTRIQGYIQDHSVFLRKNQDMLVRLFLKDLGVFNSEDEDHDIILDYKRKTIYEKNVGEIYMGNKGLLLKILLTLIEKKGQVVSKEELFERVWKDLYNPIKHDNLIYININRLRKLIEPDLKKNRYILNTAGGYMFNDAATFLIRSININDSLSKRQTEILDFIRKNKRVTIREYKDRFGISKSSAIRDLKRLKELNLISEQRSGNKSIYTSMGISG